MATYVLVGGFWIGGWAWQNTARQLRARGHDVYPATLTGLGERAHLARPEIDLETHITDVVNLIEYEALSDVILVGHSYAGIVVSGVADRVAQRLAQLVYLDSGPFSDGMAHLDFYPPEKQAQIRREIEEAGDGWRYPLPPFEQLGQTASLAGLGDTELARFRAEAVAQPAQTLMQPLRLTHGFAGEYKRAVIVCTDGDFSVQQLRELSATGDPRFRLLAAPDWRFYELPTGHWSMLSMPNELAALLHTIAAEG